MKIGNNYMVNVKMVDSNTWHNEYFIDEKSARAYANEAFFSGAIVVGLYEQTRNGYMLVKEVKEDKCIARIKKKANREALIKKCGATIILE